MSFSKFIKKFEGTTLDDKDIKSLARRKPLTESIMDFRLKRMTEFFLYDQRIKKQFLFLRSGLYAELVDSGFYCPPKPGDEEITHRLHLSDTCGSDNIYLFTYCMFILNPDTHWILCILHNEKKFPTDQYKSPKALYIFDSLNPEESDKYHKEALQITRNYFFKELDIKNYEEMTEDTHFSKQAVPHHFIKNLPLQDAKSNDCGCYVLGWIEKFVKNPVLPDADSAGNWASYPYNLVRRRIYEDIKSVCSEEQKKKLRPIIKF